MASEDEVDGATAEISGATVFDSSAVASDIVRVDAVPKPARRPVLDVELPGEIVRTLVPSEVISEPTCACAPSRGRR